MQFHRSLLAIAVMAASTVTSAEESGDNTYHAMTQLDQVTVTATRTERQLDDVASSVSVKTAEDSEQQMARNIRDLVKYEPGVDVSSDSRFGLGGFNIRGMDGNRVKITVDGVDQAKSFGYERSLQSQRNFFDIESMKQLEIVKGPASSVHGGDAIGGVAAFVTKDPSDYLNSEGDDTYASVKAGFNSADSSFNETLTLANRSDDLESLLVYTRRDGKETDTYGGRSGKGEGREEADPLDFSSDSLLGKVQYQINDDHRIGLTGEWLSNRTKTDMYSQEGLRIEDTPKAHRLYSNQSADDESERKRISVYHEWQADKKAFDDLKWSLSWQNSETVQKTSDNFKMLIDRNLNPREDPDWVAVDDQNRLKTYSYEEDSIQADAIFNKSISSASAEHYITYGLNVEDKTYNNKNKGIDLDTGEEIDGDHAVVDWMPEVDVRHYGAFAQNEISMMDDRLTLTPGVRYDRFEERIGSTANYEGIDIKDQNYNSFTGRLGAVYEINDTWSTFAQYSQGYTMPDMFAKYFNYTMGGNGNVHVLSNPDLKPEESDSIEIGLRANNHLGSLEITAFYNEYENFIEESTIEYNSPTDATFQYKNLNEATIKGLEFKGMLWLDEAVEAPRGTRLNTTIAWSEGQGTKEDKEGNLVKNEPLNTIAPLTAVIGLGYDSPSESWGSELMWTLVASKDSDDISNIGDVSMGGDMDEDKFAPPGYGLVDLTAYYKPYEGITINAGIFNITDKKYWVWDDVRNITQGYEGINRYTQPGRNFSVSVKWEI